MTTPNASRSGGQYATSRTGESDAPPTALMLPAPLAGDIREGAVTLLGRAGEALGRACHPHAAREGQGDWRDAVEEIGRRAALLRTLSEHVFPTQDERDVEVVFTPAQARELVAVLDLRAAEPRG